jgi:hypothetical protein
MTQFVQQRNADFSNKPLFIPFGLGPDVMQKQYDLGW